MKCLGLFISILSIGFSHGQLELKEIMKGNDFIGHQPDFLRWSADGTTVLFDWQKSPETSEKTYGYKLSTQKINEANNNRENYKPEHDYNQSQYNKAYEVIEGDLYAFDKQLNELQLIYQTNDRIHNVQRVLNPNHVYFEQNKNLYLFNAETKSIQQITDFKNGSPTDMKEGSFLEDQQLELFTFFQEKEKQKNTPQEEIKWKKTLKPVYYVSGQLDLIQISYDEKFITYRTYFNSGASNTEFMQFLTKNGVAHSSQARPKVSEAEPNNKLGIINILKDTSYSVDFSQLSNIRTKPKYLNQEDLYENDRSIIMHPLHYSSDGAKNICDVRSYDNKDRWIVSLNLDNGSITEVNHQHDDAWIGGPGISGWNMVEGNIGWINNKHTIYFQSEKSGYSHLYTYNFKSGKTEQITEGNWEVLEAKYSNKNDLFYISANKSHPGNHHFYQLNYSTKKLIPILNQTGAYEVSISPDEKWLAFRYSSSNQPWEVFITENKLGGEITQLTHSTTATFEAIKWLRPDVVEIPTKDGATVNARVYAPQKDKKNNAAIIFVHGAGYLQNAHNYWSVYYHEYLFHNLLVEKGYTVLDIDYRASAGYGRDHRTAIYRHMGGKDLSDQIDGKNYLVSQHGINPKRVGIYGGSYGGFIALMALLTEPDEFACGAALRSVTDWAHYNHEYTSNILNYPSTDPEAYKISSPIYYAENLSKPLIMLHGMVDDNVQFQDVVRLSQRFIELEKENWELAVYPVEPHGFKRSSSWYDEYRRILELFENNLIAK